jgi:hypothetical protein
MSTVVSRDGTSIAYERSGSGPAVVLVDGALCSRAFGPMPKLAPLLAPHFTVLMYDRRGRGESADRPPYDVAREVEDIDALVRAAGGRAHLVGLSSGAALALHAASRGVAVGKVAAYEPPYVAQGGAPQTAHEPALRAMIGAGKRGDAVKYFMRDMVGVPAFAVVLMRLMPNVWPKMKAVAHTLPYDAAVMDGFVVPEGRFASVRAPTLVMHGGKTDAKLMKAADAGRGGRSGRAAPDPRGTDAQRGSARARARADRLPRPLIRVIHAIHRHARHGRALGVGPDPEPGADHARGEAARGDGPRRRPDRRRGAARDVARRAAQAPRAHRTVVPGPYAGSNELTEGFVIVRVAGMDQAVDWGWRLAELKGTRRIDVRPVTEPWDIGLGERPAALETQRWMCCGRPTRPRSPAGARRRKRQAFERLIVEMRDAGVLVASETLAPSARGRRYKFSDGRRSVVDGPFTESKELIAGYVLFHARALDEAAAWAPRVSGRGRVPRGRGPGGGGSGAGDADRVVSSPDMPPPPSDSSLLELEDVRKSFGRHRGGGRGQPGVRARRVRLRAGAVGVRQDHAAPPDRGVRGAGPGRPPPGRPLAASASRPSGAT